MPFPLGEADARSAVGEGHKFMHILRPSPSLEASPYRACASRPLPEGEGDFGVLQGEFFESQSGG
jgi:hypothetical protein